MLKDEPEGTPSATSSGPSSSTVGNSGKKDSNAGAIAGGVVGGILCTAALVGFIIWYTGRRRWRPLPDEPPVAQASDPEKSTPPMKLYVSIFIVICAFPFPAVYVAVR